jgi:hypothetical protein
MPTKTIRRGRRRSSPADQMHLPLDETDIRHNNKLLGVYRDHNAHHAIVVKIGKTRISFVEMKKGQLTTRSLPDTKFFSVRGFERIEYPIERAVENFLRHGGGVSDAARRALLAVARLQGPAVPQQLELGRIENFGDELK